MSTKTKAQIISETMAETKLRRRSQTCVVFQCKFDVSHFSKLKKQYLDKLFLEAKWLYNYILSQENVFDFDTKIKTVQVLNKDKELEDRKLEVISSQMKQSIYDRLKLNIINLSKTKKKGLKVGPLDFKGRVWSIPLKQYNNTYKILNKKYISIQGFKKPFKVNGLQQIPSEAEFANATLVKRNDDYYIMITCYLPKKKRTMTGRVVGLDFGIADNITTSDNKTFNIDIPTSKRTRRLQRKLKHKTKFSSNWKKLKGKIAHSHERTANKRKDARNKIVSFLTKMYDVVCFQDENVKGWQAGWYGKQVSKSAMGGIISDLKRKSETPVVVDKWFPSTQLCPMCGKKNDIPLSQRIYRCDCSYENKRDPHSAQNILREGLRLIGGTERIASNACGDFNLCFAAIEQSKLKSEKQEAHML